MMRMKTQQASGWASALRVNLASTTHFKTRISPCRIAVRADHEKYGQLTENRRRFCGICTSSGDQQSQIPSLDRPLLRFTEHRTLKTEHPQPRCELRFRYAACRCNTTELLEQMP